MKRLLLCIVCCCCTLLLLATTTNRNALAAFKLSNISDRQNTNTVYTSTSEFPLDNMYAIYGLSISGHSQLNSDTSLVRVLLIDNQGKSYLVYEDFYLTASNMAFQDMAFETAYLDSVTPDKLKIIIRDATLYLNDVSYHYEDESVIRNSGMDRKVLAKTQQQTQEEYMIDRWNEYNEANNGFWFAGKTALSGLPYESKKAALGATSDAYQSDGLEYYVGGIYVMRSYDNAPESRAIDSSTTILPSPPSISTYVESFDWRNRHGRNWMTSVKNQLEPINIDSIGNGGCWAFAACATVEAGMNLYWNQLLDYDLSEQELGSCTDGELFLNQIIIGADGNFDTIPGGGTSSQAFNHMKNDGIVTEDCMPFQNNEYVSCNDKCDNPTDLITISNYYSVSTNENNLKYHLINNGPCYGTVNNKYLTHAMCLCGYGTVHVGDSITHLLYGDDQKPIKHKIEEGHELVGKTYWIYKNSYGLGNKDSFNGYFCVVFDNAVSRGQHAVGTIHSFVYDHTDIICEDRDGDGYYFWGLGEKPSHCPSCAPDTPDGDDSDPTLTAMDKYGNFLPQTINNDKIIVSDVTWSVNDTLCGDVYVQNNATLTITNANITLHPLSHILLEDGATLIVDNGMIVNAEIVVNPGGSLIIQNNGILQHGENDNVDIQLGGTLQILSGEIRNYE